MTLAAPARPIRSWELATTMGTAYQTFSGATTRRVPRATIRWTYRGIFRAGTTSAAPRRHISYTEGCLAHVPEKWEPVFRQGHAPLQRNLEHVPIPTERDVL